MAKWIFGWLAVCGGTSCLFVQVETAQAQQMTLRPALRVEKAETEIQPPVVPKATAPASAVTLKPGSTSEALRSLPVRQRYTAAALRRSPVIALGPDKLDLRPVLDNPAALGNLASRLRQHSALVQVLASDTEASRIDKGLVVRQYLSYRMKPGACSTPAKSAQLTQAGAGCFVRKSASARSAAYAAPGNPRYIANPAKRQQAIAAADKEAASEQADFAQGIAQFRAMMNDPAQRKQVEAELGAAEAARLAALPDDQLENEMVNAADVQIEEVMFVPVERKLQLAKQPALSAAVRKRPALHMPEKVDAERTLQPHILLTGFTLGREHEWRRRVSITIKTCLVSCKKTYYIEAFAGFGYGFGLRFPISVSGLYAYNRVGDKESASIAPVFQPVNGSPRDYEETGLDGSQVFKGRELVAELTAYAGVNYKVPFHSGGISANAGKDLTEGLPAPFTNGQFQPPSPGPGGAINTDVVFDQPDLLGGLANFGVVGAKVLPAVKVGLTSDRLQLQLKDNLSGQVRLMTSSGQTYPLTIDPKDHSSSFSIGHPEYSLAFEVTPGLNARLFVDVAVWSHDWNWPVWFPQVAVTLPPDGVTFTCHEKTVCSREYFYSPTVSKDQPGAQQPPADPMEKEVFDWRAAYIKKYYDQCSYLPLNFCGVAIKGVAEMTGNRILNEMRAQPKYPSMATAQIMIRHAVEADKKGKAIILESKVAAIDIYGKDLFRTYEPIWAHDCADQLCRTRIHALGDAYVKALKARQNAHPNAERNEVVFDENTQGNWAGKARQEVRASQQRAARLKLRKPAAMPNQAVRKVP
ncbi:hypothetical protein [Novosphingobium mangrovi (ex Huang et al. 2023)]|uniref:Uncharacterized protein n=1 Tax=Novosphingobium mangrovi (ex Huang et al. 2023) TaxID=2976432 RepID=A0ABT2HZY8_9SPHN|nr:hypothetical protein [Novosphingobium mangrovi (ex Huang et al. 2023)]MCT2398123.1 hypothetical protein [Novosphingobium mangrovi (ex Huang et al. 2023)]